MARSSSKGPAESRRLGPNEFKAAIRLLGRRIDELESFDVSGIDDAYNPSLAALADKTNSTLADIFGRDTAEYGQYEVYSFDDRPLQMSIDGYTDPPQVVQEAVSNGLRATVTRLVALKETFEEKLADCSDAVVAEQTMEAQPSTGRVFVVHGHDNAAKEGIARFVSRLGFEPIILHEQPSSGQTIIEKLETHSVVDFAIILLTPDDIGHAKNEPKRARARARQNVILELGLFMGKIGRNRVCALYAGDLELPSDYSGVLYIGLDDAGAWKLQLAKEMKQSGMQIDLNKAM